MIRRQRRSERPFTKVDNAAVHHGGLSIEALGLLVYVLSKPDEWEVQITDLRNRFGLGRNKCYRLMDELIQRGWAYRIKTRKPRHESSRGRQWERTEFVVTDVPQPRR